jgi:hypothetical protein
VEAAFGLPISTGGLWPGAGPASIRSKSTLVGKAIAPKVSSLASPRIHTVGQELTFTTDSVRLTRTGVETDSESLAAQIGLLKAMKDYGLKRVISFHSRVCRAELQKVSDWIGDDQSPSGDLHAVFVSGNMPAGKRKVKLDRLKELRANERAALSNARCLAEGVDGRPRPRPPFGPRQRMAQSSLVLPVGLPPPRTADRQGGNGVSHFP